MQFLASDILTRTRSLSCYESSSTGKLVMFSVINTRAMLALISLLNVKKIFVKDHLQSHRNTFHVQALS